MGAGRPRPLRLEFGQAHLRIAEPWNVLLQACELRGGVFIDRQHEISADRGAIYGFDKLRLELANLIAFCGRRQIFFETVENDDEPAIESPLPCSKPCAQMISGRMIFHCIRRISNDARERLIDARFQDSEGRLLPPVEPDGNFFGGAAAMALQ